jgi:hypothetical protein
MKNKILLVVLGFITLSILACSSPVIANLLSRSGDILYKDDFSDPNSGWIRVLDKKGFMDYYSSGFRIWVNTPGYNYWSTPGLQFDDVIINVDAARLGGPDENRFGLICRYKDVNNYYFFVISSDGYFGIGKVVNGLTSLLGQEMMIYNPSILPGFTPNHLQAECNKETLTLYINGQPSGMAIDSDLSTGDVGLLAGAFGTPGVDIVFDNFVVTKP